MSVLLTNIEAICEQLSDDLIEKWDKDKAMALNNLCEYIHPKRQRIAHTTEITTSKDFIIVDYGSEKNGGIKDANGETDQEAKPVERRNQKQ
jgi:hypothetical protein